MNIILRYSAFLFSTLLPCSSIAGDIDLHAILIHGKTADIDKYYNEIQSKFESGQLTDYELRNTYRPMYNLSNQEINKIVEWITNNPNSYPAHLIYGTYLKRKALEARGEKYISETPIENLKKMDDLIKPAFKELMLSTRLTKKPYLSIFHLLNIASVYGDRKMLDDLITKGDAMFKDNSLLRGRYVDGSTPRWGGSYKIIDSYIDKCKANGVPTTIILQMQAIKLQDMGLTNLELGNKAAAHDYFAKSMRLGMQSKNSFLADFLTISYRNICQNNGPSDSALCHH